MDKLFALILGLQLLISPVAYAEASSSQSTNTQQSQSAPDLGANSGYDKQSQKKEGGYDFYAKTILAISTSIVGANIITQCSFGMKIPSIATFMAGSLVHIASEMGGAKEQNQKQNQSMDSLAIVKEDMQKREGGQLQREILVQKRNDEAGTREFISKRQKWMMAVTAIYMAATALAISEYITGHATGMASGMSACAGVAAALAAPCNVGYAGCYAKHNGLCMSSMPSGALAAEANFANPASLAAADAACAATTPYLPGCAAYLGSYITIAYANCIPFTPAAGLLGTIMAKGIAAAYTMGVTNTTDSKTASYAVLLSSLLMYLVPSLQTKVMAAYNYPIPRSITFGASAVLAAAVTSGLNDRKGMIEKNVQVLDEVIAQLKQQDDGVDLDTPKAATPNSPTTNSADPKMKQYDLKALPNGQLASSRTCMSTKGNNFDYSEKACASPIKLSRPSFNFKMGETSVNEVGMMANDLANAVTTGDAEKADVLIGKIGSQASRMQAIVKDLQKKANDKLKADGKKSIDFEKGVRDRVAELESSYNSSAAQKGFASANVTSSGLAEVSSDKKTEEVKPVSKISPREEISIPSLEGQLAEAGTSEATPENTDTQKVASLSESLEQYESTEGDIVKDPSVSIFKQVSNRYFLNYTKLFNRKQVDPPMANAPVARPAKN